MTSFKRLLLAPLIAPLILANITGAPIWAATAPTTPTATVTTTMENQAYDKQEIDLDQEDDSFFGKPGSRKRLYWYIGAGVVIVITATAMYWYYRGNQPTKPINNQETVQPQPITTTSTGQETLQQPTIPTASPTQPQAEPQTANNIGQIHSDTLSEPDEESWGDFDASAAINAVRQGMVLTAEDERAIENDLEASRRQAVSVEIEGLRKRRFRTLHHPRRHQVSQSLDLRRMPSPEAIDPAMAKTLKKL